MQFRRRHKIRSADRAQNNSRSWSSSRSSIRATSDVPMCPYTDANSEIAAVLSRARRRSVASGALAEDGRRMRRVRRLDAVHRRRRADAPPADGRHDRIRQGQGRARLDEHQRQHVRAHCRNIAEKLERVLQAGIDLIEFSMDAGDPTPTRSCGRRIAAAPPRTSRSGGPNAVGQRPCRAGVAQAVPHDEPGRRLDHPAGAPSKESSMRPIDSGWRMSASTK